MHNNIKNIKILGQWVATQVKNYRKNDRNMTNINIKNKWIEFINSDKYKKYFILPTIENMFISSLNKVKKYIDENNKRPVCCSEDENIKFLGQWITCQSRNYKKKKFNMKDNNIYNKWTEFINSEKYKIYFQSQYEDFIMNLNKVKKYIDENNKRPGGRNKDKDIKLLGIWILRQNRNYKKKFENMKDENIYNKWTEFINNEKYKQYF
jgi:hypothetical protein